MSHEAGFGAISLLSTLKPYTRYPVAWRDAATNPRRISMPYYTTRGYARTGVDSSSFCTMVVLCGACRHLDFSSSFLPHLFSYFSAQRLSVPKRPHSARSVGTATLKSGVRGMM